MKNEQHAMPDSAALKRRFPHLLALQDFEAPARRFLPRMLFGFVSGGAETNLSLRDNRRAFDEHLFVPQVLTDVSVRHTRRTLLGREYDQPFGIAPMGAGPLCGYRSDLTLARAAAAANIPFVLSASSLIPLEEVRREAPTGWYQAYLPGDEARIVPLVERVAAAGYDTFVITADVPVPANRENNVRNGYATPLRPSARLLWQGISHPRWLLGTALRTWRNHGMPHFENMDAERGPPVLSRDLVRAIGGRSSLAWRHVELIRRLWKGKLVVKGILSPADALRCRERGVDGIVVSNHGGRQLDGTTSPLRVLPAVAEAAQGMAVMFDSGIRRGTDVLKALALGADFVFVGRPFLYAASIGGEPAIRHAIHLLGEEVDRDLAMLGLHALDELRRDMLLPAPG